MYYYIHTIIQKFLTTLWKTQIVYSFNDIIQILELSITRVISSDEEEPQTNNVGLTFYNGLMDQVNNVLQKVQTESECNMGPKGQDLAGQTMKAVKQTTLQHLKEIGVNLPPIQESSEVTR